MSEYAKRKIREFMRENDHNFAQSIALLTGTGNNELTIQDLDSLEPEDAVLIQKQVAEEKFVSERFELIQETLAEILKIRTCYEGGSLSLPGYVAQAEYRILALVKNHQIHDYCLTCSTDNVLGSMEFVCNECRETPE